MNILVPMAGVGKRFSDEGFEEPKPLIDINGKPMIVKALNSLGLEGRYLFVVRKTLGLEKIIEILIKEYPDCKIVQIDEVTEGPACTCLFMKKYIDNDEQLVITNCDQIMWWNSGAFVHHCNYYDYDGMVVTYTTDSAKNSYVRIDREGYVIEAKEKEVISNISFNGIHYWRRGRDFVYSAEKMIEEEDRSINGEFYVAPTYNYMIDRGQKVGIYHIPNSQHHAVGTPDDLREYIRLENLHENL